MLPPNNALSGMKQIKNDYHTNVMYDIAKVAGKLQIFVAHTPIDLSTVLIPNDGSFEQSLTGVISVETKIKLEESLKYLHQMQKRKNKKFDYYGLWGELAQYKLEIYIDHIGVNFVIHKYIFPNASLAEMMNHVITDYSSENEGIIRQETQNDYTSDQMVEWAEQEHFEYEETKIIFSIVSDLDLNGVLGSKPAFHVQEPLFLSMVALRLHNAFADVVGNGLISGININNSSINISHLFFADHVIITTGWNARDLENIIRILHVFYLASGLKINIHKSNIYGIGVNEDEVYNMASNAGCIAGNIPFNYLGLPVGSNMKSIASWKMLIDHFCSRLSTWKASLLPIGGRLTLIKSVLGSLGIYYLLIFRAPESVLNDLERIRSNFFWGGLNIGSLKAFNLALLQKWRWRLFTSPNDLWVKVVKAFHGHEGGFDNNGCSFKGTWANIVGSSNFFHSKGIILNNSFRFNARCGTRIRFWKDIWVGEAPLSIRYNRLYRLDLDKDCLITDCIINGQRHWNWSMTNTDVRNLDFFRDKLNEIGQLNIVASEDTCVWNLGPNGTFTVKDARNIIDQKTLPSLPSTSWDKIIPRKVNIFMWRLSLDRLPHRLNLSLHVMDIPAISCSSCNANVEYANHIFFECIVASDLWKLVYRWCEIPFVQALSFKAFKDWLSSWHAPKEKKHRLFIISTSVLCWLWRFRNNVSFNSQSLRKSDIFDYVRSTSFSWIHNRGNLILCWTDWLKSPLMTTCLDNG
ncbi:RNA-directed DNA polymerase, eukaryota, reverse transcriptase zinc-binding domain protein [Tanacetum coccineum]